MKITLLFFCLLFSYSIFSQCNDPVSIAPLQLTNANCPGSGQITVNSVLPVLSGSEFYQYSLFSNTLNAEIYTWQNSNIFPNLQAGSYEVRVRRRCTVSPFVSANYITANATILLTEVPAAISSVTVLRNAKCNDGAVSAVATGGGPLQYALVSSLTEAEPITTYVRPRQATSKFTGLPAGNYFMRVYNVCNNASTIPFTIDQDLSNTRVAPLAGYFIPFGCDSVSFGFRVLDYIKNVPNFPSDVNAKAWVKWPSGTVDTVPVPNQSNANLLTPALSTLYKRTSLSEIDPGYNPTSVWPSNLPNASYTIVFGYRDVCGVIHLDSLIYKKTNTVVLTAEALLSSADTDCDNVAYRFYIRHTGGAGATASNYGFTAYQGFEYSLDNGTTWANLTTSNTFPTTVSYSRTLIFPRGITQTIKVRYCGMEISATVTPAPTTPLNSNLSTDVNACLNKGRIGITKANSNGPSIGVRVLSVPAGQAAIPYFEMLLNTATVYPSQLSNLTPGSYTIELLDTIGPECDLKRTWTVVVKPFTFDFTFNVTCNKNLEIHFTAPFLTPSTMRVKIYNTLGAQVLGGAGGFVINTVTNELNIPGATLAALADGTYTIRVGRILNAALDNCSYIEKTWVKSSNNNLNLQNSIFVSSCADGFGALGASASGGSAPYQYTLLDMSNTIIAPTTPGASTYNGLNSSQIYNLSVLDACGQVVNRLISSNSQINIAVPGFSKMPCVGDNVTLALPNFTGVTFAWMRDSVVIPSATSNVFTIPNIQLSDSGVYQSSMTIGTCVVTGVLLINPGDCGGPLSVDLTSFTTYCDPSGSVIVNWQTASEQNSLDFILAKSADLVNWETVDILPAKGNSSIVSNYTTTDRNVFTGITYYQLIQRDVDGSETKYSPISNSCESASDEMFKVYPNPTNGDFKIEYFSEIKSDLELQIMDVNGRIIISKVHKLNPGSNTLYISEDFAKGIYIVYVKVRHKEMTPIKLLVD